MMAKKKKGSSSKGKSNDVRGYVTSNSNAAPQPLHVVTETTTKQGTTTKPIHNISRPPHQSTTPVTVASLSLCDRIVITPEIHQALLDLLGALYNHKQLLTKDSSLTDGTKLVTNAEDRPPLLSMENPDINTTTKVGYIDATKLRRRLGTIYDTLTGYGFQLHQIINCIQAISESTVSSNNITLELTLDWLCYYIPPIELPPLFTEVALRDDAMNKSKKVTSGLSFIRAPTKTAATSDDSTKHVDDSLPPVPSPMITQPKDVRETTVDSNKIDEQWRTRLIEQYQYEGDDDDDGDYDDNFDHGNNTNLGNNLNLDGNRTNPMEEEVQSGLVIAMDRLNFETIEVDDEVDDGNYDADVHHFDNINEETLERTSIIEPITVLSGEDAQLRDMKQELQTLEDDSNNDANNYMRSKLEMKELKNKVSKLRKQVSTFEAKIERQRMVQRKDVINNGNDDSDGVDDAGLFSIFDDDATTTNQKAHEKSGAMQETQRKEKIEFPEDAIPSNWTGKTPKEYLEELCRKEKSPRPTFQKLSRNGCQLTVKYGHGEIIFVEELGPYPNYIYLQNFLSAKVLYHIKPSLPLHRIFPPFYRDIWLTWENQVTQNQQYQANLIQESRQNVVDELFDIVCGTKTSTNDKTNSLSEGNTTRNTLETTSQQLLQMYKPDAKITVNSAKGKLLKEHFFQRMESLPYQALLSDRKNLPIYSCREQILDTIQNNSVTILCAETGSGKTTQCCSFILEQAFLEGRGDKTSILCTQPRRVAAISVAERVAEEWGEPSVGKVIGYQIRMEVKRSSETRILFCTTGVILRRLIEDKKLNGISHVVLDEVHERQWQIDVLLVALRALIDGPRPDLKIVLMSATLDKKLFGTFFIGAPLVNVPGRTFPVRTFYLEDLLEHTNHVIEEGSRNALRNYDVKNASSFQVKSRQGTTTHEYSASEKVSENYIGYKLETRKSMDRVDESVINYDLIEDVLHEIFFKESLAFTPSISTDCFTSVAGSVLIFLPGIGEIRTLTEMLLGSKKFGDNSRFDIIPLHSSLSSTEQKRAFATSTKKRRKIIVSTNIAETSVTIPDVVYVIDSGRFREITRDRRNDSRKLIVNWCSKASAKQRSGRAGRVQPGVCLKLYSSLTESQVMKTSTEPELQRIPLEEVCLTILASGFGIGCANFLSQTPQPPTQDAIRSALTTLEDIGAIESFTPPNAEFSVTGNESLTSLGRLLAKLPVDAKVGKMLILGSIFQCTDFILTIAATLSASKSPFTTSLEDRQACQAIHAQFVSPFSDFLTFVNVWNAYRQADLDGTGKKFCYENKLNYFTMIEIQDSRRHFLELLAGLGLVDLLDRGMDEHDGTTNTYNRNCRYEHLVHALVCAGLFPNVGTYTKNSSKCSSYVFHKSEQLFIQASVNSKTTMSPPSNWIVYSEKFGTEHRVSISKTAFILPISLILFGSQPQILHTDRKVRIDDWIEFSTPASTAVVLREIQNRLSHFLFSLFDDSNRTKTTSVLSNSVDAVIRYVSDLLVLYQN